MPDHEPPTISLRLRITVLVGLAVGAAIILLRPYLGA